MNNLDHLLQRAKTLFFHGAVPDWTFERIIGKRPVQVSSDWPAQDDDPKIVEIREQLQAMAQEDKAARQKNVDRSTGDDCTRRAGPALSGIHIQTVWVAEDFRFRPNTV
ncbi:MAG TPA: hypothetical protein VIY69_16680 [Candidatus Acidoferrales bacterium]